MTRPSFITALLCVAAPLAALAQGPALDAAGPDARLDALESRLSETDAKIDAMMGLLQNLADPAPAAAPGSASPDAPEPDAAPTRASAPLKPGMIVRVAALTEDDLLTVSQATIGTFYTTDSAFVVQGYPEQIGFDAATPVGHEIRGVLPVTEAGVHTLIITTTDPNGENGSCGFSADIAGSSIVSEKRWVHSKQSVAKAVDLKSGEYDFMIWVACSEYFQSNKGSFSVSIVLPGSAAPVPLAEVLAVEDRSGL